MPFTGGSNLPPPLPPDPIPGRGKVGGGTPALPGGGSASTAAAGTPTNLTAYTATDQATVLPIAWGTVKIPALLIEKLPAQQLQPPNWSVNPVGVGEIWASNGAAYECISRGNTSNAPSGSGSPPTAWAAGQTIASTGATTVRQSNGNVYRSISTGTTGGTAPSGSGVDFNDGGVHWCFVAAMPITILLDGTAVWRYLQQTPYPLYYQFFTAAICEGEIVGVISMWWDKTQTASDGVFPGHNVELFTGPDAGGQFLIDPRFDASGYQHTALVSTQVTTGAPSGTQAEIPDMAFETKAIMFGVSTLDVNPADILTEALTHPRRGREWLSSRVGSSVGGAGASSMRTWCDAKGLRFSYLLDTARASADVITDLMYGTNCIAFMGQGQLEVVPLDDTPIPSPVFGSVGYVPPLTASFTVTPDDLLDSPRFDRRQDADCFNSFPVEYQDRSMGYVTNRVENPILSDVRKRFGLVRGSTITLPFTFQDGTIPVYLSRVFAQQSLYNRNTYTVKVGPRFIAVEPGDVGFIPVGDSVANYQLKPVRVIQADEDTPGGNFTLTCVDSPPGAAGSVPYVPAAGDGLRSNTGMTTGSLATAYQSASQTNQSPDNLWPNANSEASPPSYIQVLNDGSLPEWDYRVALSGVGTFTGSISGTVLTPSAVTGSLGLGSRIDGIGVAHGTYVVGLGGGSTLIVNISQAVASEPMTASGAFSGDWSRSLAASAVAATLTVKIPCVPGEQFYMEAQAKFFPGGGTGTRAAQIGLEFYDQFDNLLAAPSRPGHTSLVWALLSMSTPLAPLGVAYVKALISITPHDSAQFDAIVVRRIAQPAHIAAGAHLQGLATDSTGATVWAGDTAWTNATLINSWVTFGGTSPTPGFMKDPSGRVSLRGAVKSGSIPSVAFVLPSGYRPAAALNFACPSNGAFGYVGIDNAGNVNILGGSNVWIDLSGISFSTT